MEEVFLTGYSDKLSVRVGEEIKFFVSTKAKEGFTASLFRSISADPNPANGGVQEEEGSQFFEKVTLPSRYQPFFPGSYAETASNIDLEMRKNLKISFWFYPTFFSNNTQCVFCWDKLALEILKSGDLQLVYDKTPIVISSNQLQERIWYKCEIEIIKDSSIGFKITSEKSNLDYSCFSNAIKISGITGKIFFATKSNKSTKRFNGKIEEPIISVDGCIKANWDFSEQMHSLSIPAKTKGVPKILIKNSPTRAVTGRLWNASEFNWKHKPEHYAAIHFHDDDLYDFEWEEDFSFRVPDTMPPGVYVMRIEAENHEDAMPFFVCSSPKRPKANICVLISTFTYIIYGNHARPDFDPIWKKKAKNWNAYPNNPSTYKNYGLSTYNLHSDGSGISIASHKRPLFNLRPGYITFGGTKCSGLRHFQADSHLISWLHHKNIEYDLITDFELHNEGYSAISDYKSVMTGSHPEYHTAEMLDALTQYRDSGGGLLYLGGNGFYWKIAIHKEDPSFLEIRRSEDGLRAWASESGEYYNAFDGGYGGLWRRNNRPPQKLVGIGFTAQGNFVGMPYKRVCYDREFDWVFKDIKEEILGDFGFSGNGAAGFELDRCDHKLDDGQEITILAQSFDRDNQFILVPEEMLTHLTNLSGGPEDEARRADMVYFKTKNGGQVFSVGSITFCGSLPWNDFNNNISKLLENVIKKFIN